MKQPLKPNTELDILTQQELFEAIDYFINSTVEPGRNYSRDIAAFVLSGAGASGLQGVYTVPAGYVFELFVLGIQVDTLTTATGVVATGITVLAGDRLGWAQKNAPLPFYNSWGSDDAPRAQGGEKIAVIIEGGPVNGSCVVTAEGKLTRQRV